MIEDSQQQQIDRDGCRLLREALEPLGWLVNEIRYDYGIDYDVQVLAENTPNGIWFKIQLKSSASTEYSRDNRFISEQIDFDHAKHYSLELRDPVLLVHADVVARKIFWCAPQLDPNAIAKLTSANPPASVTFRIPTSNNLPETAAILLRTVEKSYVALAGRTLSKSTLSTFAETLRYQPGEEALLQEFQAKTNILKLRKVHDFLIARRYPEARSLANGILRDPETAIDQRFWAQSEIGDIDWGEAVNNNRPQAELPRIYLENAKRLQVLTKSGPAHLKFYALVVRKAAELDQLVVDNWGLTILLHQHFGPAGNPLMALGVFAAHVSSTHQVIAKYNQCLRLAKYAANFRGRWVLSRALIRIVQAAGSFIGRLEFTGVGGGAEFHASILQICKLVAWIGHESGDDEAIALAASAALLPERSQEAEAFRWALRALDEIKSPEIKRKATELVERHVARWRGGALEGDSYRGNPAQQIMENAAAALGIDLSDETDPLVRGLRIAAMDNSPERALRTCEDLIVSRGATGPVARQIEDLMGIQTAGSKVLHCALHSYHREGKELDSALAEFKHLYCDSCPDKRPRPTDWKYTPAFLQEFQAKHLQFIRDFNATGAGYRLTERD